MGTYKNTNAISKRSKPIFYHIFHVMRERETERQRELERGTEPDRDRKHIDTFVSALSFPKETHTQT